MTEAEWLTADAPHAMIAFVNETRVSFRTRWQGTVLLPRFKVSERKWQLFYAACIAGFEFPFQNEEIGQFIQCLQNGDIDFDTIHGFKPYPMDPYPVIQPEWLRSRLNAPYLEMLTIIAATELNANTHHQPSNLVAQVAQAWSMEELIGFNVLRWTDLLQEHSSDLKIRFEVALREAQARQANLLREILGNPFTPPVFEPSWLTWENGTVPRIARMIDEHLQFADMPILADALEDAGCDDPSILQHCRAETEHVRGCWVVDLLLQQG